VAALDRSAFLSVHTSTFPPCADHGRFARLHRLRVLGSPGRAADWVAWLTSEDGQSLLRDAGFGAP
ncbi:hypothetical protein OMR07_03230, partial [Methylobacterium organophilum]|nr:hypothetical protein [Methylobacterium organophilum]